MSTLNEMPVKSGAKVWWLHFSEQRRREREKAGADKRRKRAKKTERDRAGLYKKRPGRETDKLEAAKTKEQQKISRLRDCVWPLLKAVLYIKDTKAFLSHTVVAMRKEV